MLTIFGAHEVAKTSSDGGIAKWKAEDARLKTGQGSPYAHRHFTVWEDDKRRSHQGAICLANLHSKARAGCRTHDRPTGLARRNTHLRRPNAAIRPLSLARPIFRHSQILQR